jgi:hypothetical protein
MDCSLRGERENEVLYIETTKKREKVLVIGEPKKFSQAEKTNGW